MYAKYFYRLNTSFLFKTLTHATLHFYNLKTATEIIQVHIIGIEKYNNELNGKKHNYFSSIYSIFIDRLTGNAVERVRFLFRVLPTLLKLKPKEVRFKVAVNKTNQEECLNRNVNNYQF